MVSLGMPHRPIVLLGDPLLRELSLPVVSGAEAEPVFEDLRDTLHEFRRGHGFGRGISAVQIGVLSRLIYIEFEGREYRLRNPVYEYLSGDTFELWDDCFSFPGLLVRLRRSVKVRVRYDGTGGEVLTVEADGALSELLQHEMDHLDGILAVDRALGRDAFCVRGEWERRYQV